MDMLPPLFEFHLDLALEVFRSPESEHQFNKTPYDSFSKMPSWSFRFRHRSLAQQAPLTWVASDESTVPSGANGTTRPNILRFRDPAPGATKGQTSSRPVQGSFHRFASRVMRFFLSVHSKNSRQIDATWFFRNSDRNPSTRGCQDLHTPPSPQGGGKSNKSPNQQPVQTCRWTACRMLLCPPMPVLHWSQMEVLLHHIAIVLLGLGWYAKWRWSQQDDAKQANEKLSEILTRSRACFQAAKKLPYFA